MPERLSNTSTLERPDDGQSSTAWDRVLLDMDLQGAAADLPEPTANLQPALEEREDQPKLSILDASQAKFDERGNNLSPIDNLSALAELSRLNGQALSETDRRAVQDHLLNRELAVPRKNNSYVDESGWSASGVSFDRDGKAYVAVMSKADARGRVIVKVFPARELLSFQPGAGEPEADITTSDTRRDNQTEATRVSPETALSPEEETNRLASSEILTRSDRLRLDVIDKATEARIQVDRLLAGVKNGAEWPDRKVAEWHMKRAEASLAHKQARVERKGLSGRYHEWRQEVARRKIDSLRGSDDIPEEEIAAMNRLERFRLSRVDNEITRQQQKISQHQTKLDAQRLARQAVVDSFELGTLSDRSGAYAELTSQAEQRTQSVETRSNERLAEVDKNRQAAIARSQEAYGRKTLRAELRSAGANRAEAFYVSGEVDSQVARDLGRKVVESLNANQAFEASQTAAQRAAGGLERTGGLRQRVEQTISRLPGLIESNKEKQAKFNQEISSLDIEIEQARKEHDVDSPQISQLEDYRRGLQDRLQSLAENMSQLQRQQEVLPDELKRLVELEQRQRERLDDKAETAKRRQQRAESARQSVDEASKAALGINDTRQKS